MMTNVDNDVYGEIVTVEINMPAAVIVAVN